MRNGTVVWYCKRTSADGDEVLTYDKPVQFRLRFNFLTIQPAGGYTGVVEFGENVERTWIGMAQPYQKWFNTLKEGDRFYLDGAEPYFPDNGDEPDAGWGFDANATITSVRPQNFAIRFTLTKIE